jgi:hypothetical protein
MKVHHHVHKSPSFSPVLSFFNPFHTLTCNFFETEIDQWINELTFSSYVLAVVLPVQCFLYTEDYCFQVQMWNLLKWIILFLVAAILAVSLVKQIHGMYMMCDYRKFNKICF